MSTRRLAPAELQPKGFSFTEENLEWAKGQVAKYPEGRQASAVIPLLWRAQEQEGWVSRAAIEHIAGFLEMPEIRVLEVATFYFMFHLKPVGSAAHFQICGTTCCMLRGSEDLMAVAERVIGPAQTLSSDGKLSWEEVECLGACTNAPMLQVYKDFYEDLTPEKFEAIIERFRAGEHPLPGPQNGRVGSEPEGGATTLIGDADHAENASVELAIMEGAK